MTYKCQHIWNQENICTACGSRLNTHLKPKSTSNLFGAPHFEVAASYGFRETLLGRRETRGEAEALRHDYAGMEEYKHIIIRQVEL